MLQATKFIRAIIEGSKVVDTVGDRIYPTGAIEGTQFPFVVFSKSVVGSDDTKDGPKRVVTAFISVYAKKEEEAEQLADLIFSSAGEIDNEAFGFSDFQFGSEKTNFYQDPQSCFEVIQEYTFETL